MKKILSFIIVAPVLLGILVFWVVNNKRIQINNKSFTNTSTSTTRANSTLLTSDVMSNLTPGIMPNFAVVRVRRIEGWIIYYELPNGDSGEKSVTVPLSSKIFGLLDKKLPIYSEIKLSDIKSSQVIEITFDASKKEALRIIVLQ